MARIGSAGSSAKSCSASARLIVLARHPGSGGVDPQALTAESVAKVDAATEPDALTFWATC